MNKKPYIPDWIFRQGFSAHQLAIYLYVYMRGQCFETKKKIYKALRINSGAFYSNLNALVQAGWIMKSYERKGKAVTYTARLDGAELSDRPIKSKRKATTRKDREARNMIMLDDLRVQLSKNGLDPESSDKSNVA